MDIAAANEFRQDLMSLHRRMRKEHVGELSLNEVLALGAIDRSPAPATPTTLADHLDMAKPNVATLVRTLQGKHLVERTPDPVDGRRAVLGLTPAGRQLLERDRRERERWLVGAVAAALTADEARTLVAAGALMRRVAEQS